MTAQHSSRGVLILGASGSIGRQTLAVLEAHPQAFHLEALSVHRSVSFGVQAALKAGAHTLVITDEQAARDYDLASIPSHLQVLVGMHHALELIEHQQVHTVVNALVGSVGLQASYKTLSLPGKRLALANKESLVVGGDLLMPLTSSCGSELLPIDSEHGALFQCFLGENRTEVAKMLLTASGGPFYGYTRERLSQVTRAQALNHPTWSMGSKITIDSATLMNKGLEVIEAHHLFAMDAEQIEVVVHRQSIIHSMLEFVDGSIKAHLGTTDMRIPIQYALTYPTRLDAPLTCKSIFEMSNLTFERPDLTTFGCLRLAFEACRIKQTLPAVMNAANEVAVEAFLQEKIGFLDIERVVEQTMYNHSVQAVSSIDQLVAIDQEARSFARSIL